MSYPKNSVEPIGEFRTTVLESGLKIVAEMHSYVRSVSLGLWVKIGSCDENPKLNGASHFIEHMVFKGTQNRNAEEIATVLESRGGELNAFTDREYTCFHATVLKEDLALALDVISDLVTHPLFDKKHFDKERRVVLQELAQQEDAPEDLVFDKFAKMIWKDEPLGLPILGTPRTLASMKLPKLVQFYLDHYSLENMVLSVAGNFDFDELKKMANLALKDCSRGQKSLTLSRMPSKYHPKRRCELAKIEQQHVIIGYEGTTLSDPDRYVALILCVYLGGGMGSRLFQEVRERQALCYSIDVDLLSFAHSGVISIYSAVDHKDVEKYFEIIGRELNLLKSQGIKDLDLERVKGQLRGSVLLSSEVMELRQESLGRSELIFERPVSVSEVIESINGVTAESVFNIANRVFQHNRESVFSLGKNCDSKSWRCCGR